MKHLIKKNKWECLLYSVAMATGVSPEQLIRYTGHDGSGLVDNDVPGLHKGWHIQEFILPLVNTGFTVTPLEFVPVSLYRWGDFEVETHVTPRNQDILIARQMYSTKGVITGFGGSSKTFHAVAYEGNQVYDPDGPTYSFDSGDFTIHRFHPQTVWIVK